MRRNGMMKLVALATLLMSTITASPSVAAAQRGVPADQTAPASQPGWALADATALRRQERAQSVRLRTYGPILALSLSLTTAGALISLDNFCLWGCTQRQDNSFLAGLVLQVLGGSGAIFSVVSLVVAGRRRREVRRRLAGLEMSFVPTFTPERAGGILSIQW